MKSFRKITLALAIFCVTFSYTSPVFALDEVFYSTNDILYYAPCESSSTGPAITGGSGKAPSGQVKVAQANIKTSTSDADFKNQLDKVIATNPDFVSGNEWTTPTSKINRPGYGVFRNKDEAINKATSNEAAAVVIMWRSDRWKKVDSGYLRVTLQSDVNYTSNVAAASHDGKRGVAWTVLEDSEGNKVTFMATHMPVNPNKWGPQGPRKALYKKGMDRMAEKVKELQAIGPVILAGDFNAQFGDDGPWHPRTVLGNIGMEMTADALGKISAVDHIFYTKDSIKAVSHGSPFQLTDHPLVVATLAFDKNSSFATSTGSTGSSGCTCSADPTNTITSSIAVAQDDNLEALLNYFTGKGFSLAVAAGIAGNIKQESSFNPKIIQGGAIAPDNYTPVDGVGFGLAQWTYTDRQAPLVAYAKSQNKPITDLTMQLDYMFKEMQTRNPDMTKRLATIKDDPLEAAVVFHGRTDKIISDPRIKKYDPPFGYEGSGDDANGVINVRGAYAAAVYQKYRGDIKDGAGVDLESNLSDTSSVSASTTNNCEQAAGDIDQTVGVGSGKFSDSGEVAQWDSALANAKLAEQAYGDSLVGNGTCAAIVSRVWRGQNIGYGYNYAIHAWEQNPGLQHKDRSPKKGAILLYRSSQPAGHVVIYLGGNKILNDGNIVDADAVEGAGWGLDYLGWMDPNDLGWKSVKTSNIKAAVGQ
jgi:hypothetical protein